MKLIFTSATVFDETLKTFLDEEFQKSSELLEITINANEKLLSNLITYYLNNPKIPRTYLIKLENISPISAWALELTYPGKFKPYIKKITECAISEIHYVYQHFSPEEAATRLDIKKTLINYFANSIVPSTNYYLFRRALAPELQHIYNKSYADLAKEKNILIEPYMFNSTDLTSNKQPKRGEVNHTVEEIHVGLSAGGKWDQFGCTSGTFPRVLGRSKFNLTPEKLRDMSKQAAQKLWGCEYYQKISNNGIDQNHFTIGLIYAVVLLSSSQFEAAGRLGVRETDLGTLLHSYHTTFRKLKLIKPQEAPNKLPGYQIVEITNNDYQVPLNGIKPEYHHKYLEHPMVCRTVPTPSSQTTALTKLNCLSESLEKAIDFTQIPYKIDATFKLHFAPETGALVITPILTDISQLRILQQKLEEYGVMTYAFTHYLYIEDVQNIEAFFSKYFATKQNEINQELKGMQEFGSTTLTVLQKLVLIAIGLRIYEFNKKKLTFKFREENIRCPWIDPDNNLCIEMIENSNGRKEKLTLFWVELQKLNLDIAPLFLELLPMIRFGNKNDVIEIADHLNNTSSNQLGLRAPEAPVTTTNFNHSFFMNPQQSGEPATKRICTSSPLPSIEMFGTFDQWKALREKAPQYHPQEFDIQTLFRTNT